MCSLPLRYFLRCLALATRMLKYIRVFLSFPFLISLVTIMSNLGEFSWSFSFGDCTQLSKRKKSSSLSGANRLLSLYIYVEGNFTQK